MGFYLSTFWTVGLGCWNFASWVFEVFVYALLTYVLAYLLTLLTWPMQKISLRISDAAIQNLSQKLARGAANILN